MAETTKKATPKVEPKKYKHEIMVSIYSINGKPISVKGIANDAVSVSHKIKKSLIKPEDLFSMATALQGNSLFSEKATNTLLSQILRSNTVEIEMPYMVANEIPKKVGNLEHEIKTIDVEI